MLLIVILMKYIAIYVFMFVIRYRSYTADNSIDSVAIYTANNVIGSDKEVTLYQYRY